MPGPLIEECEKRTLFAGVTLLIPAWNGGLQGWIATQASALTAKLGGPSQVPNYTLTVSPNNTNGALSASISHVAGTATPQTGNSGQIILVLDYTSVSTNPSYALSYVASVAATFMANISVDGIRFSELPLHEVAISRGTGEADEIAKALGQSGIWVEQETYLDPHVVSSIGDAPSVVYNNVEFADEYWRTTGLANPVAPEVNSAPLAGAYQSNIQSLQDDWSGTAFAHVAVAGYYNGTIDLNATQGGDGAINSDWYGVGYPERNQTGFYYSAIAGGTRPLSGVWAASGGTGTRTATGQSGTQWPNVADVASAGGSRVPAGQPLNISYIQQDRANAGAVTFYLDTDANPYNNNFAYTLGSTPFAASAAISSGQFSASTAGIAPGTYYICAKVADGQGHYRFADSQAVTFTQTAASSGQLSGVVIGTPGSYNNAGATIAKVFDGDTNTFFDAPGSDGNWAGLDLGAAQTITRIAYAPRAGFESRMVGGIFQASTTADFSSGVVNLATISSNPADGLTTIQLASPATYEFVRYLAPPGSYGNIAEMQVFGTVSGGGTDSQPPTQPGSPSLLGSATSSGVALAWSASSDNFAVDHYNVFRNNAFLGTTLTPGFTDLIASAGTSYSYTVQAFDAAGNASAISGALAVTTAPPILQISGSVLGTTGSYDGVSTRDKAFDGNITTFFDASGPNGNWVGLDLGVPYTIARVVYAPRTTSGFEQRMVGGVFQGSTTADFSSGVVNLATIYATPHDGWNGLETNQVGAFRYVRYLAPDGSYGNVSEVQFLGSTTFTPAPPPPPPADTTPPAGSVTSSPPLTTASSSAYNFVVTWTDNVAVKAASLGNQNLLVSNGSGYSQSATLVSSGLVNGATVVATYSAPAPTGGWTNSSNGTYTVALQANQVADASGNFEPAGNIGSFSVKIPLPVPPASGGSLTGVKASAASSYNLTTLGTADWAHWGRGGKSGTFDHKTSGATQISNVSTVGTGGNYGGYSDASRSVTWTDGTPTSAVTNDHGYLWANGALNTGYSFTVPADTTSRTLTIYAGGINITSSLTAHLSDGSAADVALTAGATGLYTNVYTITYHAASAGQKLTITLLKTGNLGGFTNGSADLIAAFLTHP